MPGNALFKLVKKGAVKGKDDVQGESLQSTHLGSDGWCEASDWSFDIEAETNFLKGTGAAVGVATPGVVSIAHSFEKSSPPIMLNIIMGTAFDKIVIHMLKSTGAKDGKPEVYFGAIFKDAFITKVSSKGGEDGSVTQDVEFVYKSVALGYKPQKNTGELDQGLQKFFDWNVAAKTLTSTQAVSFKPDKDSAAS